MTDHLKESLLKVMPVFNYKGLLLTKIDNGFMWNKSNLFSSLEAVDAFLDRLKLVEIGNGVYKWNIEK